MRITITESVVKHGGKVYHGGDTVTVDDELGAYFVRCGWASSDGQSGQKATEPVTLDVHSATHKSGATFHG